VDLFKRGSRSTETPLSLVAMICSYFKKR
jgi:hypothetical protein